MSWIVILILLLLTIFIVALALVVGFLISKSQNGFHGTPFNEWAGPQSKVWLSGLELAGELIRRIDYR